jgi:hypothetical protein
MTSNTLSGEEIIGTSGSILKIMHTGAFIGLYLLLFTFFLLAVAIYTFFQHSWDCFFRQLIYYGCSGGLAGLVYSFFVMNDHLVKEDFKADSYFLWYISRPIVAAILGVVVFFFVAGGLMGLSSTSVEEFTSRCQTTKSVMFFCALAFLTGYSTDKFIKMVDAIADVIFATKKS